LSTIPPISRKQKKVETVMVDNSTNINKTKERLNSDGQQFHQYQQNRENLNSDAQQFHQYQQNRENLNS
jgi:FtsZ-binding cell division protein ZapB